MNEALSVEYVEKKSFKQHLKIKVYYDLGGWNHFSGEREKRGYYLSVTPVGVVKNNKGEVIIEETAPFTGTKILLKEVNRKSKKRSQKALELAKEKKEELIQHVISKNPQFQVKKKSTNK